MTEATPRPTRHPAPTVGRMNWYGRKGAPKPPAHIWAEMMAAGAAGDDLCLGIARAEYEAWLTDQGYRPDHPTGNHAPDEVWQ